MVKVISPPANIRQRWWERIYIPEIFRGLWVTISHLMANLINMRKGRVGKTYQWPETPKPFSDVFRGEHRLMHREDGTPRCVACCCCATACPADCIEIVAEDTERDDVEKYPVVFNIDILQCVFCGFCVEACPCDAIRMDTDKFAGSGYEGPKCILDINYLMKNHPEGTSKISEAIY